MNKKIVFRIIGALASALIISSVFVPFVSVAGYTTSLWESFGTTNALYLPIMIIVFGAIGVIFFALNIKTEFAYMSTGAISFFVIMRTIDIINQGTFETLSVGYYFLVAGAILTGLMAFLTNLKTKEKVKEVQTVTPVAESTMLDQIDKLYNDQVSQQSEISPIQPVDNVVEPIPVQPIEVVEPVQPIQQMDTTFQERPIQEVTPVETESIVVPPVTQQSLYKESTQVNQVPEIQQVNLQPVNPVVQEFPIPSTNPVVQEFSMPQANSQPVIQEQPISDPEVIPSTNINESSATNPVLQEFTNSGSTEAPQESSNLDIFG